jgi:hypothetical protein
MSGKTFPDTYANAVLGRITIKVDNMKRNEAHKNPTLTLCLA